MKYFGFEQRIICSFDNWHSSIISYNECVLTPISSSSARTSVTKSPRCAVSDICACWFVGLNRG